MNFKHVANSITVACVVAGAAWWFWPARSQPEKTRGARSQLPSQRPVESMLNQLSLPEPDELGASNPWSELDAAIPEMIRLLEAGDLASVMSPQGDEAWQAERTEGFQALAQTLKGQQMIQDMLTAMKAMQTMTPTYDPTGNVGLYRFNPPIGEFDRIDFVKVNGRWYFL